MQNQSESNIQIYYSTVEHFSTPHNKVSNDSRAQSEGNVSELEIRKKDFNRQLDKLPAPQPPAKSQTKRLVFSINPEGKIIPAHRSRKFIESPRRPPCKMHHAVKVVCF